MLIPLRLNLSNVCVYLHQRRSKFVYFVILGDFVLGDKKCVGNVEDRLGTPKYYFLYQI